MSALVYRPRLRVWKRGDAEIDPARMLGTSYRWWVMLREIPGVGPVLNSYPYSVTTRRHVSLARQWLRSQGISYREIAAPRGLQDLESAERFYRSRIESLRSEIAKPGTRESKNTERRAEISRLAETLDLLERVQGKTLVQ